MREGPSGSNGGLSLSEYAHVLWRWKWMILIVAVAATAGAYLYSWAQAPRYVATASILYVEPVDPSDPLGGSYYSTDTRDLAVENVLDLIGSSDIAGLADQALADGTAPYNVTASARSGTSSSSYSGVVDVSATAGVPDAAAAAANAYAQAIVDWRKSQQLERIVAAEKAVEANMAAYTTADSRRTTDYIMLQQRLQNLKLLATTFEGDFRLISEAVPPSQPSSPKPRQAAVLGLGVGLLVGVGLAFLLEPLTRTVSGKHEAAEALELPILGTVPEIERRSLDGGRLVALSDPRGQPAESLRLLRSNLDYFNAGKATSLLVTSALAGEGKSTLICNLAATLTLASRKVVLVDGDIRRPRVHEYFGLTNDSGLSGVLDGSVELVDALHQVELRSVSSPGDDGAARVPGDRLANRRVPVAVERPGHSESGVPRDAANPSLFVLTAGPQVPDPGELIASQRLGDVMRDLLAHGADLVLVDSPALMEVGDAAALASRIDALVVVVDLKRAQPSTLREMRDMLAPLPCKQLGAVLVKSKGRSSGYGYY